MIILDTLEKCLAGVSKSKRGRFCEFSFENDLMYQSIDGDKKSPMDFLGLKHMNVNFVNRANSVDKFSQENYFLIFYKLNKY